MKIERPAYKATIITVWTCPSCGVEFDPKQMDEVEHFERCGTEPFCFKCNTHTETKEGDCAKCGLSKGHK